MFKKSLVFIAFSAAIAGCGKELPPVPEPESRPVKMTTVSVGNSRFERSFPAVSEAGDRAVLAFRVPGLLMSIDALSGQLVNKGDVLALLNPDEYTLLAQQAQANFNLANVQFKRAERLRKDRVVSEQDYDEAKANLNVARASLNQAKANVRYTQLVAPYDGTISIIPADNHEYVAAQQGVMNIQTNQLLKIVFQLPDHLLSRYSQAIQVQASMQFDAFPERSFPLTFQEIDTEADPTTASYKVTMIMDRPSDIGVLPGMVGSVNLVAPKSNASRIPLTSIQDVDGGNYVWRVNDEGIVKRIPVELNQQRQVVSGLNDGDQIVVSGVASLQDGIKVRPWVKERGL
ncbi:efflux RND transporter periplasmic adaptor subunit [Vibrio agarivorans]|uniref:efflux RND transporter periplasmic adaptor subunit n=1 Tax=Vibrio agarivorans TaxID=153622 RepID=UPI002231045D|nr:efflux RND transporter periplasmic adaptor subunit [Vibrio agarivorans]